MNMLEIKEKEIIVFTDGSSRGNPGPGGFGVVALYPDAHSKMCVDELGGREESTTNNRMELKAVIEAIKNFIGYYSHTDISELSWKFYVDSGYVIQGAQTWIKGWKKNNWYTSTKEPVKNKDLWEEFDTLVTENNLNIIWNQIEGHAGVFGNERCDVIATNFADNKVVSLFTGPLSEYQLTKEGEGILNIDALDMDKKNALKKRKSGVGTKAYSYVSSIDGVIEVHSSWAECEHRVKGKSKARTKPSI